MRKTGLSLGVCVMSIFVVAGFLAGCGGPEERAEAPPAESTPARGGWDDVLALTNHASFELTGDNIFCENVEWDGLNFSGSHSYEGSYLMNRVRNDIKISGRISPDGRNLERFRMERTVTYLELSSQDPVRAVYEVVDIPNSGSAEPASRHFDSPIVRFRRVERPESAGDMVKNFRLGEGERWHTEMDDALLMWRDMRNVVFSVMFSRIQ